MTPITARAVRRERFAPLHRWISALDANSGAILFLAAYVTLLFVVGTMDMQDAQRLQATATAGE